MTPSPFDQVSIQPLKEIASYEALWESANSFKEIAGIFRANPGALPSDLVRPELTEIYQERILKLFEEKSQMRHVNTLINSTYQYPTRLRDARDPVELLYYKGNVDLLNTRSIAIIGARNPSDLGIRRARKIVQLLVRDGYTIASGLAKGIDTIAHKTAIDSGGQTFAVIGTPIDECYPRENRELQDQIGQEYLLISQIPFFRYKSQNYQSNKRFFPERNKTMSTLTEATIIIEASDISGTLHQARAALYQGRKLFILNSCFEDSNLSWPAKFEKKGAIRVGECWDVIKGLAG